MGSPPLLRHAVDLAVLHGIELPGHERDPAVEGVDSLTTREHEVLGLISAGHTNRRIARTLGISEKTVSVHVSNVLRKLAVGSRTEAAGVAFREGLVPEN